MASHFDRNPLLLLLQLASAAATLIVLATRLAS